MTPLLSGGVGEGGGKGGGESGLPSVAEIVTLSL